MTTGSDTIAFVRQTWAGLRVLLVLTVLLGFVYPLAVTGIAQVAFPWQANGSLVASTGERVTSRDDAVGSLLIGQASDGPEWFHPRPSAAGDGYDTLASAGSNLGPLNKDLLAVVEERRAAVADAEGVDPADVPVDALTASGSGLDPDSSPEYAQLQVARVARERGLSQDEVRELVDDTTVGRDLGVLGEPRVNVLRLNLALQTMGS
ncbi:potassium-transporting ATPase subunit KdpC [Cellulomonas sp.]|uniref:potassium-transporting ATPase subunit KdpC n=1 Tax=Cellulomonas sp. TaxID=40001 RepID=UPI003BAB94CC